MKVRTRKARINFTLARELWLTRKLKKVATRIEAEFDNNLKTGNYKKVTLNEFLTTFGLE